MWAGARRDGLARVRRRRWSWLEARSGRSLASRARQARAAHSTRWWWSKGRVWRRKVILSDSSTGAGYFRHRCSGQADTWRALTAALLTNVAVGRVVPSYSHGPKHLCTYSDRAPVKNRHGSCPLGGAAIVDASVRWSGSERAGSRASSSARARAVDSRGRAAMQAPVMVLSARAHRAALGARARRGAREPPPAPPPARRSHPAVGSGARARGRARRPASSPLSRHARGPAPRSAARAARAQTKTRSASRAVRRSSATSPRARCAPSPAPLAAAAVPAG